MGGAAGAGVAGPGGVTGTNTWGRDMGDRCRHCRRNAADTGRRGLCRGCHTDRRVRAAYPPAAEAFAAAGVKAWEAQPAGAAAEPTGERPGTAGKLAELERRATLGLALFSPGDAGADLS